MTDGGASRSRWGGGDVVIVNVRLRRTGKKEGVVEDVDEKTIGERGGGGSDN